MASTAEIKQLVADMVAEARLQTTELESLNAFNETLFAKIKELLNRPDVPDEVKADIEALRAETQKQKQPIKDAFTENTPGTGPVPDPVPVPEV